MTKIVNCDGCNACCHGVVVLHPSFGDDPTMYEHEVTEHGVVLKRRVNGDCWYLGPNGCTIWGWHPAVCREFDCREYVLSSWATLGPPYRDEATVQAGLARIGS